MGKKVKCCDYCSKPLEYVATESGIVIVNDGNKSYCNSLCYSNRFKVKNKNIYTSVHDVPIEISIRGFNVI